MEGLFSDYEAIRKSGLFDPEHYATAYPDVAAKPQMLVAVESLGVAGTAEGRSRLSINGWALAAAPISEITAAIGGVVVGRATYGLPRPDIGRLYPGRDHAGHSGFMLNFD